MRLAVGSQPREILTGVLREGIVMAIVGIAAGGAGGWALARVTSAFVQNVTLPGWVPILGSAAVLVAAAVLASAMPASRADVVRALRAQ